MSYNDLSPDELSLLSGRLSAPSAPPKDPTEAAAHLNLILEHKKHERRLIEKEAKEVKRRREELARDTAQWEIILNANDFEDAKSNKSTVQLWRKGLPPQVRARVWEKALGNPLGISSDMYEVCVSKARRRARPTDSSPAPSPLSSISVNEHQSDPYYQMLGVAVGPRVPAETALKQTFSREAYKLQRRYTNDHLLESMVVGPHGDASLALGTLSEDGATLKEDNAEDDAKNTIASPRTHVKDNTNAIAIDLPRTVITRSNRTGVPPPYTTIEGGGFTASSTQNIGSSPGHQSAPYSYGERVGSSASVGTPLSRNSTDDDAGRSSSPATANSSTVLVPPPATTAAPTSSSDGAPTDKSLMVLNMCQDGSLLHRISELLRAFVEYRPDVGYVQGMSYLAAMLLLHIESDEKSFVALASLLAKGHLQYFYTVQHRGIGCHIGVFESVLQKGLPSLHRHFQVIGVVPQMYVIDWWMSLFSRTLPYEIASRCWDLFLLDEAYLYRISLSLLIYFGSTIHDEAPIDEILMFLSKIQNYTIQEERFFAIVGDCSKYPPSMEMIHKSMREHLAGLTHL